MKTKLCRPILVETKEKSRICHLSAKGKEFKDLRYLDIEAPVILDSINYQLILISLDPEEKIEVGDIFLVDDRDIVYDKPIYSIQRCKAIQNEWIFGDNSYLGYNPDWSKKVIATQSQLSPKYIQQFIEEYNKGEVKDIEIEIEENLIKVYDNLGGHPGGHWEPNGFQPKLTNGFVTIIKKELDVEYYLKQLVKLLEKSGVRKYTCINSFGYSQLERDIVNLLTKNKVKEPITYTKEEILNKWDEYVKYRNMSSDEYLKPIIEDFKDYFNNNKKK